MAYFLIALLAAYVIAMAKAQSDCNQKFMVLFKDLYRLNGIDVDKKYNQKP